ncbi:MAG: hypothetical protein N0C81_15210 [Candidatus Thiodiazotropha lotti]|nr:hypothetical protein [Candidatus Thiodiazotropha lotti]MCG8004466.1 hypothetical protein [Candidatus Thiodiazotropha lotti]MCG8008976.1 hypothetical protein [Candidatus Thiodiazotropha lotti]MCW4188090.1 hypothetical protein [Candidatus Thiodiazotropha lotti]MCW4196566.1 hypothetical protein [Candidatus Thiodiazotropha lotti]
MKVFSWKNVVSGILVILSISIFSQAHAAKPLLEGGNEVGFVVRASDGTAWGWGDNRNGELGDSTGEMSTLPVKALDIADIVDISTDDFYSWTAAALSDGTVWVWGNVLGRMTHYMPFQIRGFSNIVDVAAGPWPMAAVGADGSLWEYALNSVFNDDEPRQINGVNNAVSVAVSLNNPYVLRNDGTVWTWEQVSAYDETLGYSVLVDELTQIDGLTDIVQIDGGYDHALALRADGTIWAWGKNAYGQLGNGSFENSNSATQVEGLTGAYDISAGYRQSAAVLSDGSVWTWGRWKSSITDFVSFPEQVGGFTNAVQVSTGRGLGGLVMDRDGDVVTYNVNTVTAIPNEDDSALLSVGPVLESQIPTACRPTYFMNGKLHLPCVHLGGSTLYDVELSLQAEGNLRFAVDAATEFTPSTQLQQRNCMTTFADGEADITCLVAMDVTLGLDNLLNVVLTHSLDSDTTTLLDLTQITSY